MKHKPILEPEGVDLVLEGRDMTEAERKRLTTFLRKSRAEIQTAQEEADARAWIDQPVPTLQQLILQDERELGRRYKDPSGVMDIDESGIGGTPTTKEKELLRAYIRTYVPLRRSGDPRGRRVRKKRGSSRTKAGG